MRYVISSVIVCLTLVCFRAQCQITIEGQVTDLRTGNEMPGVNVTFFYGLSENRGDLQQKSVLTGEKGMYAVDLEIKSPISADVSVRIDGYESYQKSIFVHREKKKYDIGLVDIQWVKKEIVEDLDREITNLLSKQRSERDSLVRAHKADKDKFIQLFDMQEKALEEARKELTDLEIKMRREVVNEAKFQRTIDRITRERDMAKSLLNDEIIKNEEAAKMLSESDLIIRNCHCEEYVDNRITISFDFFDQRGKLLKNRFANIRMKVSRLQRTGRVEEPDVLYDRYSKRPYALKQLPVSDSRARMEFSTEERVFRGNRDILVSFYLDGLEKEVGDFTIIDLERQCEPRRPYKLENTPSVLIKEVVVDKQELEFSIRDYGSEDGDVVSIWLNGASIRTKLKISKTKQYFSVTLNQRVNYLMLKSVNAGKKRGNTAELSITNAGSSEIILLQADNTISEALRIVRK